MADAHTRPLASYRELVAWQRAMDLAVLCCSSANDFPAVERFALGAQLRRAAVSVPANVAEGYGRTHRAEYVHHVAIARGSLKEVETLLLLATRLRYLEASRGRELDDLCARVGQLLTRLMISLQRARPQRRAVTRPEARGARPDATPPPPPAPAPARPAAPPTLR